MGFSDLTPDNTVVDDDGNSVGVDGDRLKVESLSNLKQMATIVSLLYDLKEELKIMNMHFQFITEEEIEAEE